VTQDSSKKPGDEALKSIEPAMVAIEEGRLEDASRICAELVEADPTDSDALHLLGVIGFQGGAAPDQALDLIDRAVALDPRRAQYQNSRGALLYAIGRNGDAEASFRRAR